MKQNTIKQNSTLIDAVRTIESSAKRLAVVIDQETRVIGTLTDGDIRRSVLDGYDLNTPVTKAMNKKPIVSRAGVSDSVLQKILIKNQIRSIPIVDEDNRYLRTLYETQLYKKDSIPSIEKTFIAAVIMAGGEGSRLRPLTEKIPKPMVDINGIPLLERQIRGLEKTGIKNIYISINYLGQIIKDHFLDGSNFGVKIHYLQEDKKLGTAGALSLLPSLDENGTLLLMNGDIFTKSDFVNLYHFHKEHKSSITMSAIDYHVRIPYGVIERNAAKVTDLKEKPSQRFFCNAGIYAISTKILKKVPAEKFWNMTDFIELCLRDKDNISVFPVHEYWTDIGTVDDLENARKISESE
jgi:dTDP-glucose pyrophosphorylase